MPKFRLFFIFGISLFVALHSVFPSMAADQERPSQSHRVLRSASELDYPPFAVVRADGTPDGFSVELLRAVARAAGLSVAFQVGPWHQIKQQLIDGRLDVLPLVSYSEERDRVFDFSAPYLRMHGAIFVRKNETSIRSAADLKNKEVLVMRGDTAHEYAVRHQLTARLILTKSFEEALQRLSQGKHDAVIIQKLVGLQLIKKLKLSNLVDVGALRETDYKPADMPLAGFEQKFCIAVKEGDKELLSRINEGLTIVITQGTYNRLYNKWFGPLLPQPSLTAWQIAKYIIAILVPLALLMGIVGVWYLKRQVARKTRHLNDEIRERESKEAALRDSEKRFRELFDNMNAGVAIYTSPDDGQSFIIKDINRFGLEKTHRTREQVIGREVREVFTGVEALGLFDVFRQVWKTETAMHHPCNVYKDDQLEFWAENDVYKLPSGDLVAIWEDTTARVQAEEALRKSERRLRTVFQAAEQVAFIITDTQIPEPLVLEFSPGAERIFGYTREEMLGATVAVLHRPEDAARFPEVLDQMRQGKRGFSGNATLVRKSGEEFPALFSTYPLLDEKGSMYAAVGVSFDVSKQQRLESQLRQAHKMESVGRLAGGVAHDFNNMLGIIIGHAEIILEDLDPEDPMAANLQEIYKAAHRSANLTRQLLAFARKDMIDPKMLNLNQVLDDMLKMLIRLIGEDIDLVWRPGLNLGTVMIDPSQIDQILANLCINARDAIKSVGKVTIETGNISIDEAYASEHAGFKVGDYVMIAVSDNGRGMDKSTLDNLFEPFFTTKEIGEGSGLGLATVFGIVKRNNGFINVYSELGQGTTFKIYLPRHEQGQAALETVDVISAAQGRETILLVEDEDAILKMTTQMLERLGYSVLCASSPEEALRISASTSREIDLLMTDVVMPQMNGRDLARNVSKTHPHAKCLFMSGYTANVIAHHGVLDQDVKFINKPFSKQELAAKLREVLDHS